jgi:DNA polymerase III epsilon subunit family exonuclease
VDLSESWVVVDVETTGLSSARDRIIEIGAVAGEGRVITGEFHSLIDAGHPIPWQAQKVHGISDEMLRGQPRPEQALAEFHRFLGHGSLVAHNASFDVGFLQNEFGRLGLGLTNRHYCTLRLARQRYPRLPNHRLETVFRYLGGVVDDSVRRHRALDDARMAAFVWRVLSGGG